MDLLSNNVNTKIHPNFEDDFKEYISGIRSAHSSLCEVVEKYGSLIYDIDYQYRIKLKDNLDLLETSLIKMLRQTGYFRANIYQELFNIYLDLAKLAIQANRHDFLVITAVKVQILTDFVLKNTK